MGNKNKTYPQINEFEFIAIKKHAYIKIVEKNTYGNFW